MIDRRSFLATATALAGGVALDASGPLKFGPKITPPAAVCAKPGPPPKPPKPPKPPACVPEQPAYALIYVDPDRGVRAGKTYLGATAQALAEADGLAYEQAHVWWKAEPTTAVEEC